jgi:hypothetical protein
MIDCRLTVVYLVAWLAEQAAGKYPVEVSPGRD